MKCLTLSCLLVFSLSGSSLNALDLAKPPTYADAKASFSIIEATWGAKYKGSAKQHCSDVKDHLMDLLVHRGWLKVNSQELRSDPWPYHSKFLYLMYQVLGKTSIMILREKSGLTLHQLIKHAGVLPPGPENDPPIPDDTSPIRVKDVEAAPILPDFASLTAHL